ncbi:MAG TPA: sulfatase-like hydrolase/transferase, partial [Verrucomicrobiae bacterium]|nr:sulfatase-like hydrolase/transferase [Verrucomicrobiae bacterium]
APFKRGQGLLRGLETSRGGEYLTDRLTDEALKFIEANQKRPFFVMLAHYAVHIPLSARTNLVKNFQRASVSGAAQTNAIYAAMIESVDEDVGKLMAKLEKLRLVKDTVVVFTSDNGGLSVKEGPNTPSTSNAPLREGKGYLHEGGIRVPLIIRYPGTIPAGTVVTAPMCSMDFFPTLVEWAGAKLPDAPLDGISLAPFWTLPTHAIHPALYWHYPHYSNQGGHPAGAIREGDWKLIENYESGYMELYKLGDDVGETNNLAQQFPQRANDLQKKLADWRRSIGAQTNTLNPEYIPVPIGPTADGSIVLPAHEVTIHGVNVRYEPPAHKNTIGYWTRVEDWVSWEVRIDRAGTYQVEVLQGCGKGSGNSEVEISLGDQKTEFVVQDTGGFQNFVRRQVGELTVPAAGHYTLAVRPHKKPGVAVMDLRELVLRPVVK